MIGYYTMYLGGVFIAGFGAGDVLTMARQGRLLADRLAMDQQMMLNGVFAGGLGLVGVL